MSPLLLPLPLGSFVKSPGSIPDLTPALGSSGLVLDIGKTCSHGPFGPLIIAPVLPRPAVPDQPRRPLYCTQAHGARASGVPKLASRGRGDDGLIDNLRFSEFLLNLWPRCLSRARGKTTVRSGRGKGGFGHPKPG